MWISKTRRGQCGFTLLEVLVALGILATTYVALLQLQGSSVRNSSYSKQVTIATFLAQAKLEETEEALMKDGFPDMNQEEAGDFDDLGYPHFGWRLEVNKVELPLAAAFDRLLSSMGGGTDDDQKGTDPLGSLKGLEETFKGQLGDQFKSKMSGLGSQAASMLNPDMLKGQVEMLATMLEQAIREVRLTVFWDTGQAGDQFSLTTHLVQVPQAPSSAGQNLPGGGMAPGSLPPGIQPPGMQPPGIRPPFGSGGQTMQPGRPPLPF